MTWEPDSEPPAKANPFAAPALERSAIPLAFLAAWLLNGSGLTYFCAGTYHEFGHAAAFWLTGWVAIPLPMVDATASPAGPSLGVTMLVLGALGWLARRAWLADDSAALSVCAAFMLLAAYLSFACDFNAKYMWAVYGGHAGELLLPALVIAGFYYKGLDRWRWDFWRYPLLLTAAFAFVWGASHWAHVIGDPEKRIWFGEDISKSRDLGEDLVRLVQQYGWSARGLASSYWRLVNGCGLALAAVYLWFGWGRAQRRLDADI